MLLELQLSHWVTKLGTKGYEHPDHKFLKVIWNWYWDSQWEYKMKKLIKNNLSRPFFDYIKYLGIGLEITK